MMLKLCIQDNNLHAAHENADLRATHHNVDQLVYSAQILTRVQHTKSDSRASY